jgi:hypothetical protein
MSVKFIILVFQGGGERWVYISDFLFFFGEFSPLGWPLNVLKDFGNFGVLLV